MAASWCSYDTSLPELAMTVCRQAQSICSANVAITVADTTVAATSISVNSMVAAEKCTWVVKATLGAPSF